jgi:O-acetyl-ADP-ribose deacetylase (regulator of RNase III)
VIDQWLFGGESKDGFPVSQLALKQGRKRFQENFAPKKSFSQVPMIGEGKYSSRMGVHSGGITDLKVTDGQTAAIGDSNNGDLLTGCGFAVATAVVNATGPNLQRDLYNRFGVPGVMEVPKYGEENYRKTEGRGYAVSCDAHDMRETHGIGTVEFLTVPMYSQEGVRNMYREAFAHSKDKDFIVLPMAGMSHPVLRGKPNLSANIATEEFRKFCDSNPDSKLKVVFAIYNDQASESLYKEAAINQDGILD